MLTAREVMKARAREAWNKIYDMIHWKNLPNMTTALGATNLNRMDVAINTLDNRVIQLDAEKLGIDVANLMIASWTMDMNTYVITVTQLDGTVKTYDLNLERIPISTSLSEDGILTFTYADGSQDSVNVADLIKDTIYDDSDTIGFSKTFTKDSTDPNDKGAYHVTATVKDGSIEARHLNPDYRADIQNYTVTAQTAASDALTYSKASKRWAVGDNAYPGSETDNSKFYKEEAEKAKTAAEKARDEAQASTGTVIMAPGRLGVGMPDGTTIVADDDGTIHGAAKFDGSGYVYVQKEDDSEAVEEPILDADLLGGNPPEYYMPYSAIENGDLKRFMISSVPSYYIRDSLFTPSKTTITIHADTQININGRGYYNTQDVVLNTSGVAGAGKNVYIYACIPETGLEPQFVLSQNSTVPSGYNADNSRKIGGFHCLCANVGTISGHPLSGYVAGDILPASVWDLKHRPVSEPEGMVYDAGTGRWYDIYLASWNGTKLVSQYGATIADGTSAKPFHGLLFKEKMGKIGKRLLWRHEFMVVAKGSNECTNINTSADPGTTGGHVDTAGRRMISDIGLEDCCGVLWQWVNDEYEHYATASNNVSYHTGTNTYMSGYSWTNSVATYNGAIDDKNYGDSHGFSRQALAGAYWSGSSRCGSRSVFADVFGSYLGSAIAARGASEPRVAT